MVHVMIIDSGIGGLSVLAYLERFLREENKRGKYRLTYANTSPEDEKVVHMNFCDFNPSYHVARYNFIYKVPKSRTPLTIAKLKRTVPDTKPSKWLS